MNRSLALILIAIAPVTLPVWAAPIDTAAPPQVSELQHRATGVVKKIDRGGGTISIQHSAIQSLGWPAMTMEFTVQNQDALTAVKPGARVEFDLVKGRGEGYVITRIAPLR